MIIWPTKKLRKVKAWLILTFRRYRIFFRIGFQGWIPRLYIHERFEKYVKWSLRFLLFISIIGSIISFQVWYFNLLFSILLVIIEQLLERVVFIFTTLFVTPIPESYNPEDWVGMVWGFPVERNSAPFSVGILFRDRNSAKRIFSCLKSWNYNEVKDLENNISISAIIESNDEYTIYIYPGLERISLKQWEKQVKEERWDREHQGLVMQIIFCKKFKLSGSSFEVFKDKYKNGKKFILVPYSIELGRPIRVEELGYIVKDHIKIKKRSELGPKEDLVEYEHGKFVMNL